MELLCVEVIMKRRELLGINEKDEEQVFIRRKKNCENNFLKKFQSFFFLESVGRRNFEL